jgi:hypothetical protein
MEEAQAGRVEMIYIHRRTEILAEDHTPVEAEIWLQLLGMEQAEQLGELRKAGKMAILAELVEKELISAVMEEEEEFQGLRMEMQEEGEVVMKGLVVEEVEVRIWEEVDRLETTVPEAKAAQAPQAPQAPQVIPLIKSSIYPQLLGRLFQS